MRSTTTFLLIISAAIIATSYAQDAPKYCASCGQKYSIPSRSEGVVPSSGGGQDVPCSCLDQPDYTDKRFGYKIDLRVPSQHPVCPGRDTNSDYRVPCKTPACGYASIIDTYSSCTCSKPPQPPSPPPSPPPNPPGNSYYSSEVRPPAPVNNLYNQANGPTSYPTSNSVSSQSKYPTQPQYMTTQPQYSNPQPQYSNPQPQNSNPQPQYANAQPQYSNPRPQYSNPQPQYSNSQPQNSNLQPQYSNPQSQYSNPQPQYANIQPQYTNTVPQYSNSQAASSSDVYQSSPPNTYGVLYSVNNRNPYTNPPNTPCGCSGASYTSPNSANSYRMGQNSGYVGPQENSYQNQASSIVPVSAGSVSYTGSYTPAQNAPAYSSSGSSPSYATNTYSIPQPSPLNGPYGKPGNMVPSPAPAYVSSGSVSYTAAGNNQNYNPTSTIYAAPPSNGYSSSQNEAIVSIGPFSPKSPSYSPPVISYSNPTPAPSYANKNVYSSSSIVSNERGSYSRPSPNSYSESNNYEANNPSSGPYSRPANGPYSSSASGSGPSTNSGNSPYPGSGNGPYSSAAPVSLSDSTPYSNPAPPVSYKPPQNSYSKTGVDSAKSYETPAPNTKSGYEKRKAEEKEESVEEKQKIEDKLTVLKNLLKKNF